VAKTSQELRAELDALDKKIREQQSIQIKSAREFGSSATKRLEAAGAEEARLRALAKEKFAELAAANKDNRLDFLKAERQRLLAEEEALQREYSLGPNNTFLTGAKLEAWEARVRLNNKDLSQNFKDIQAESGENAAKGQTATAPFNANFAPDNPGTGTPDTTQNYNQPVTAQQRNNLSQSQSGQLAAKVDQRQDPTATNKQNAGIGSQKGPRSEATFSTDATRSKNGSVVGKDVTGKNSDYQSLDIEVVGGRLKNKMHDYTSYTYRITLFLLTKKDYNALATEPDLFVPTFSLISSGAGFATPGFVSSETIRKTTPLGGIEDVVNTQTKAGRHPDFQTDFFIDNLQLTTVVGLNAKSKASNAIEISFNITEPYGLSLLDRLLSACETCGDRNPNYMSQPYLLQIDLIASATDEILTLSQRTNNVIDTKRIAIKMLEMKIKPTGSGTTYAVRAIPFNHTAFSMTTAAVPIAIKVEAGTVGEFFSNKEDFNKLFSGAIKAQEERLESELEKWIKDNTVIFANKKPTPEQIEAQRRALKQAIVFNSKSFTAAYNTYMIKIAEQQQLSKLPPTKIAFAVDNEFVNSPIVDDTAENTNTRLIDPRVTVGQTDNQYKTVESFNIREGTNIVEVIDQVMSKSLYIKKQIRSIGKELNKQQADAKFTGNNDRAKNTEKPEKLKWYRIVPTVALNDFDAARNDYSKTILYNILPYAAVNSYHPNFPKTTAGVAAQNVVREYNYLYTGENEDIIRLDIDFDSTYYTQLTTYRNQVARMGTSRLSDPDEKRYPDTLYSFRGNNQQTNLPQTIQYTGVNKDSNSMNTSTNPEDKIIADLKKSIYTSQRGDLLNIKLQIVGDPDFIKQDDVYYNPGNPAKYLEFSRRRTNFADVPITASGQILFDAEQIFVKVNFKNAVDIDDSIGIVNKQDVLTNGRRTDGTFTGVYKVLTVTSEFNRGVFTQTLDLVRMPDVLPEIAAPAGQGTQPASSDTSSKSNEEADNAKKSAISRNAAGIVPPVSPRLTDAANQPPVSDPQVNNGAGNSQASPNATQSAPQNANNAQNIAPQNTAGWTFADAFRQARKDFGNKPGGVFEWRGKLYQTNYQNEPFVGNPKPVYPGANQ
jgi:hypothetical protein